MSRAFRLKRRWRVFARAARCPNPVAARQAFADLDRRYREPGRGYHTWAHVSACLRELRRAGRGLPRPEALALELALWFHDAVYVPGAADNEQASAELAVRWGRAMGMAEGPVRTAADLILATRHEAQPQGEDRGGAVQALIRDIDLSVLGRGRCGYGRYLRGIRREYAGLPEEEFRRGRAALLREFLGRERIYATGFFGRRFERRARRNLARELARLCPGPAGRSPPRTSCTR